MSATCNFYTRLTNTSSTLKVLLLGLLIAAAAMEGNTSDSSDKTARQLNKNITMTKSSATRGGMVYVTPSMLPYHDVGSELLTIRVSLKRNRPPPQPLPTAYINTGIRSSFYAVRDDDTFPCTVCERIPGINKNDLTYMICFNTAGHSIGITNMRLFITDTIAGFGITSFQW